jgi:putative two-component system response regulator
MKTILIVDDAPENVFVLKEALKKVYRVLVAINGKTAIKISKLVPNIDLVLLDIVMPDINGYDVCQNLKGNPSTKNIPVIFISASTQDKDKARGFEVGASDYIIKPIDIKVLLSKVESILS